MSVHVSFTVVFEVEDLDVKVAQVHMSEKTVADWAGITKVPAVICAFGRRFCVLISTKTECY